MSVDNADPITVSSCPQIHTDILHHVLFFAAPTANKLEQLLNRLTSCVLGSTENIASAFLNESGESNRTSDDSVVVAFDPKLLDGAFANEGEAAARCTDASAIMRKAFSDKGHRMASVCWAREPTAW